MLAQLAPLLLLAANVAAARDHVWVEGEAATARDVKAHPWYGEALKKDQLSGGAWVSHFTDAADGEATYEVTIPAAGDWRLWVRASVVGAALSYRIGDGAWTAIDTGKAVDVANIAADGKPDLRIVGWLDAGALPLRRGKTTVAFKFHSANSHHGGIDCFLLTRGAFVPNGALRPGQKLGLTEPGWWPFEPDPDPFRRGALLDLRGLNENVAGEKGFVTASGDGFRLGDGTPVRFWGVNTSASLLDASDDVVELTARRWAKLGINLVRIHAPLFDRKGGDPPAIDHRRLAQLHRTVAALKRQGIYSAISHFFPLWMRVKPGDGIADAATDKHPFGLLFFEPRMQELYAAWLRQILTTKVAGKALVDEAAVACIEIVNEDSLFFWTFSAQNLGPGPLATLERRYAAWLTRKHGDLARAFAAWGKERHARDDAKAGRAALLDAFHMTRAGMKTEDKRRRMTDQIAFLATVQRDFYAETVRTLRALGLRAPVSASNWTTADDALLGGVERWTYTAADIVDKHGYFGGKHEGDAAAHSVRERHTYQDRSALLEPLAVPVRYVQTAGKPHLHSELAWNKPNRFVADAPLLVAATGAVQGVDGYVWFAAADGKWLNDGNGKWTFMMPGEIGQSPAAALQFRRGDVRESPALERRAWTDDDVLALRGTGIDEGKSADFRAGAATDAGSAAPFPASDEVRWDHGTGLLVVDTPRSQAITGFLGKAGAVKLRDLTITSPMEYGTVHVISLDDRPIATSRRILIQAFSEEKMYGFRAAGGVIQDVGRAPILVRDIGATVSFHAAARRRLTTLDANGYARGEAAVAAGAITVARDALYTVATR